MGRVASWPDMKPRNSAIVHYLIFPATWWEWAKQKLYLQSSLSATSYPLRKYPNLSVAQVPCWWGYHQMLFSGERTKQRCTASAKLNFWGLWFMKKLKYKIRIRYQSMAFMASWAMTWSQFLNEYLSAPWCSHVVCGDAAPFSVLTGKAPRHGKTGAQPQIWEESCYKIYS